MSRGWNRIGPLASSVLLLAAAAAPTRPAQAQTFEADKATVLSWLKADNAGRYMITGAKCVPEPNGAWVGAETLPAGTLQRCTYTVTSCGAALGPAELASCKKAVKVTGPKSATVVLLEPGLPRFATWVATGCATIGGDRAQCLAKVYGEGKGQANWQIPMSGIVYEALAPAYVEYGYAFRDGLTVRSDDACGWANGSQGEAQPTPAQDSACSTPSAVAKAVSPKARPMSTKRSHLVAWDPALAMQLPAFVEEYPVLGAAGATWARYVRQTLLTAAVSDSNPLVTARAAAVQKAGAF